MSNTRCNSASALAVLLAVVVATSSSSAGVHGASISRRQFPSDAPSCATLCISAKIREAADPGLATSCNGVTGAAYVTCLCSTSTFTRAYNTCLNQNCICPADVATAKSLFSSFCNSPTADQIEAAEAVAQRADVSRSSYYATASTSSTSGASTSGAVSSTSGATVSVASSSAPSSAVSTTTLPSTTGSSSTLSGGSGSSTTIGIASSSGTTGTTGTAGTVTTLPTSGAPENTNSASLQAGSSGATLGAAGIASARANATGVNNAASSIDTRFSAVLATICGLAIGFYLV